MTIPVTSYTVRRQYSLQQHLKCQLNSTYHPCVVRHHGYVGRSFIFTCTYDYKRSESIESCLLNEALFC